ELLVERSLELLKSVSAGGRVLDLCTGSGAIILSIAHARPDLQCYGVDLSPQALAWAKKNLKALGLANCELFEGDLFEPLVPGQKYDLITSNPPYVAPKEYSELPSVVKDYEPKMALEAADDGLLLERSIIRQAPCWLKDGGALILEMGETQGRALSDEMLSQGYSNVSIIKDLCARDRFAEGHISLSRMAAKG
ncbi:MAG: peptide chain release factor N(5)-glutamine methyltransferase, partial [Lentisphaeria bacterium]|nr:peptide chain release factor N(5)-glutamine methyltransferase [Lentisphaeria bacterium]